MVGVDEYSSPPWERLKKWTASTAPGTFAALGGFLPPMVDVRKCIEVTTAKRASAGSSAFRSSVKALPDLALAVKVTVADSDQGRCQVAAGPGPACPSFVVRQVFGLVRSLVDRLLCFPGGLVDRSLVLQPIVVG